MKKFNILCILFVLPACGRQPTGISNLSLDEKIGQLFMVATVADPDNPVSQDCLFKRDINDIPSIKTEDEVQELIDTYKIGGVIFLGNSSAEKQYEMTARLIANNEYKKLPLLFALDAEWGAGMRLTDAVKFPFNIALGAIQDASIIEDIATAIGESLKNLQIDINFAPVVDCNTNPDNPVINRRSFGQDQNQVASRAIAFIDGLHHGGVLACAKHFPGHGDTATDSHTALPVINKTEEQLINTELIPFKEAINHGIEVIMTAHIVLPALDPEKPATLSPIIIKKLLREECKFDGLVVTDALDMDAITKQYSPEQSAVLALQAGCDLLVAPVDVPRSVAAIKQALNDKTITMQQLDDHVTRIVNIKRKWCAKRAPHLKDPHDAVNNERLIALSKKAYEKSMTLISNNNLFPLKSSLKKLVIIEVGSTQENSFTQQIKSERELCISYLVTQLTKEERVALLKAAQNADGVIITLENITYAKPTYGMTNENSELIHSVVQSNKNVALVLFGNPYAVQLFEDVPTILVAYENHPFAQEAAAHVVLGKIKPTGKLPVDCSPLYKLGQGISY